MNHYDVIISAQKKAERQAELKNKFEKLKQERIQRYQVSSSSDGILIQAEL